MVVNILSQYERSKQDNTDDAFFYSQPRFVHHLDNSFRTKLTKLYRSIIPSKSIILDLMSSWTSHLPEEVKYQRIIGHGLNSKELEANTRLDSFWVQDLNINQKLPLENSSIDICLMVAAWQYLQYPENLSVELRRVLKEQGKLIISFSNRAFWTKAPKIWTETSDSEHIAYIKNVLMKQGWSEPKHISENNYLLGPLFKLQTDPFFSVIAEK